MWIKNIKGERLVRVYSTVLIVQNKYNNLIAKRFVTTCDHFLPHY